MYTDYFGFKAKPFNVTADPRFFYTNSVYQEAYASLRYGIQERKGFILLTGEVGTGKTTLLRRLMSEIEPNVRFVFFYNTTLTFEELISFTCEELGLSETQETRLGKLQALNKFLIEQLSRGGTVALLIDEAQHLNDRVLEDLRLLSNLETGSEKLLQIVLVGQPELDQKLERPALRQVKQRIAVRFHLDRLKGREVGEFIHYRLRMVGYERRDLFTPEAIQRVARYSRGIPRLINLICDSALVICYGASRKTVPAGVIEEVARDLRLTAEVTAGSLRGQSAVARSGDRRGNPPRKRSWAGRVASVAIGGALALVFLGGGGSVINQLPATGQAPSPNLEGEVRGVAPEKAVSPSELAPPAEPRPSPEQSAGPPVDQGHSVPVPERSSSSSMGELLSRPAEAKPAAQGKGETAPTGSRRQLPPSLPTGPKERTIVIERRTTLSAIALKFYGDYSILALDLISESNPYLEDLDLIRTGETLWLPPLTRETLVRQHPDGSYSVILASFSSTLKGRFADLIRQIRLQGYDVRVTPRRVTTAWPSAPTDNQTLYRVEIVGLRDREAVDRAWETALARQWFSLLSPSVTAGRRP